MRLSPQRLGIFVAVAAFLADQISKYLLLYSFGFAAMAPGERIAILPILNLVMVWNRGISYGLFQAEGQTGTIILTLCSLAAMGLLSWWLAKADRPLLGGALGLIIGGALGNVVDRIIYGAVADFFHLHAFGHDWYVFNIADAAITIGVTMLLVESFTSREPKRAHREPESGK